MTPPPPRRPVRLRIEVGPTSLPMILGWPQRRPPLWTRLARAALRPPTDREATRLARAAVRLGLVEEGEEGTSDDAPPEGEEEPDEEPPDEMPDVVPISPLAREALPPPEPGWHPGKVPGVVGHWRAEDAVQLGPGRVLWKDASGKGPNIECAGTLVERDPSFGGATVVDIGFARLAAVHVEDGPPDEAETVTRDLARLYGIELPKPGGKA